jgi:serine/threonine-protein kinase
MNPDRWREVERLCHETLDRPPGERHAFLEVACGADVDLRREVDSLIGLESAADRFLEVPAMEGSGADVPVGAGTALAPGARLGPYEITAFVGAGGMGEVYKARDTRLGRTVAIKILPASLGADPEHRRRFEHEARAASSLDHPHICTLHDIGSDHGVDFLVMEFLEGQTLAERLKKGALPLGQALDYGAQIADALAKAHRQGIVHRDVKPANIMLTKSGAKLLDFGIAKLKEVRTISASSGASTLPTHEVANTWGVIVGTVAYMAPERIDGLEADARTDLFAFGCVLYEMLAGQRAFPGETEAATISAIMTLHPPLISSLLRAAPRVLDHLVQTCLAKDPDERMQNAQDVANQLRWFRQNLHVDDADRAGSAHLLRYRERIAWSVATAALLTLIAVIVLLRREPAPSSAVPLARLEIVPPKGVTLADSSLSTLAISSDGRTVVFAGDNRDGRQLYMRRLDRPETEPLAGTEGGATLPFFSPDGRSVGFYLPTDALMQVPISGGTPTLLGQLHHVVGGAAWSPDGAVIVGGGFAGLERFQQPGAKPAAVTTLGGPKEFAHIEPQMLPDGGILFVIQDPSRREEHNRIAVYTPSDRKVTVVLRGVSSPRYVPDGYVLFARGRTLRAVRFDLSRLAITGDETVLAEDVSHDYPAQWFYGPALFDVSSRGTLVYIRAPTGPQPAGSPLGSSRLALVDRSGTEVPLVTSTDPCTSVSAAPDGRRLAVRLSRPSGTEIQTIEIARDTWTRVSYGADHGEPTWTPDGRLVFPSNRDGYWAIYSAPADGSETPRPLTSGADMSPHGGTASAGPAGELVFTAMARNTMGGLWVQKAGTAAAQLLPRPGSTGVYGGGVLSPDGRLLAYVSRDTGGLQTYIREFPSLASMWNVSSGAAWEMRWSRDGSELFFTRGSKIMSVRVTTTPQVNVGRPHEVLDLPGLVSFDVMPDGSFATLRSVGETPAEQIIVVPDWRRLLPSR